MDPAHRPPVLRKPTSHCPPRYRQWRRGVLVVADLRALVCSWRRVCAPRAGERFVLHRNIIAAQVARMRLPQGWRRRARIANLRGMGSVLRVIRFVTAATLALLCAISSSSAGSAAAYADVRKAFQDAYARATAGISDSGAADSESLKSYPLYPYLQSARIQQALMAGGENIDQADKRAAEFMAT